MPHAIPIPAELWGLYLTFGDASLRLAAAIVLSMTREQLDSAPSLQYESSQTVPPETKVARLVDSGQQAEAEQQQAQQTSAETEQQQAEQKAQAEGSREAQGQEDEAVEMASSAAATGAAAESADKQSRKITTFEGKVLMIAIDEKRLKEAPSFQEGNFPEVSDAEWQKSVLAFYEDLLQEGDSGTAEAETGATPDESEEGGGDNVAQ